MNIEEYIGRLRSALAGYNAEEAENAVEYYRELIEDADDPEAQMESLGTPEQLAQKIINDNGWGGAAASQEQTANVQYEQKPQGVSTAHVIATVLTAPFWLTAFIVLLSLIITVWAVYAGIVIGALSALVVGVIAMFHAPLFGCWTLLGAVGCAGLSMLLFMPAVNLTAAILKLMELLANTLFSPNKKYPTRFKWLHVKPIVLIIGGAMLVAGGLGNAIIRAASDPFKDLHSDIETESETIEFTSDIDTLNVDINLGELEIVKSDSDKARLEAENVIKDKISVKDDKNAKISYIIENDNSFSFDFDYLARHINFGEDLKSTLTLYLPEKEYESLVITDNLGSVAIGDTDAKKITVEADCGEIELTGVNADTVVITDDLGDVKITDCEFGSLDSTVSCGNLECDGLTVNGLFKTSLDLGDAEIKNCTANSIDAELSCGDLEFVGRLLENSSFNEELGDIEVTLIGDDYNVSANTELGDTDIDNGLREGKILIDVRNSCGDITVNKK